VTQPGNQVGSAFVQVDYRTDTTGAVSDIEGFNKLAARLVRDVKTNIDVDTTKAQAQMAVFRTAFEKIGGMVAKPDLDTSKVMARVAEMRSLGASLNNAFNVNANLDTGRLNAQMAELRARLANGLTLTIGIKSDLDRASYAAAIGALRARIATEHPTIEIETRVDHDRITRTLAAGIGAGIAGAAGFVSAAAHGLGQMLGDVFTQTARHGLLAGIGVIGGAVQSGLAMTGPVGGAIVAGIAVLAAGMIAILGFVMAGFVASLIGAMAVAIGVALAGVAGLILAGGFIGIVAGAFALGIAAVSKDPQVQGAFARFKENTWGRFMNSDGVKAFIGPLVQAMDQIGAAFQRWMPMIDRIMKGFAPLLAPVTSGFIGMIDHILPALQRFAESQFLKDLFNIFGQGLVKIGEAIGGFINKFLNNGPAMAGVLKALEMGFQLLSWAINGAGDGIIKMSAFFGRWMANAQVLALLKVMGDSFGIIGNKLLDMVDKIVRNHEAMDGLIIVWHVFIAVLSFAIDAVAAIIIFFASLISKFVELWRASEIFRFAMLGIAGVLLAPIAAVAIAFALVVGAIVLAVGIVGAAIGLIVFAVMWMVRNFDNGLRFIAWLWSVTWNGLNAVAVAAWQAITAGVVAFWNLLIGWFNNGLNFIRIIWNATWGWVAPFVIGIWNWIAAAAVAFWNILIAWFNFGLNFILNLWNVVWGFIGGFVMAVWNAIATAAVVFWNVLIQWFNFGLNFIFQLWSAVWTFVLNLVVFVWQTVMQWAAVLWSFLTAIFSAGLNFIQAIWGAVWNFVVQFFMAVVSTIIAFAQAFWAFLTAIFQAGLNFIQAIWSAVWNFCVQFFLAVAGAISNAAQQFWNFMMQLFQAALNFLQLIWQTVWNAIHLFVVQTWQQIFQTGAAWWAQIRQLFESALNLLHGAWNSAWSAIHRFVLDTWTQILATGRAWWEQIKNLFFAAVNAVHKGWNDAWTGMHQFLLGTMKKIADGVKGGINSVIGIFNKGIGLINGMLGKLGVSFKIPDIPGLAGGGLVGGLADGGPVELAHGGPLGSNWKRTRPGRPITGQGGGREDRVPLMGSRGEFVVNKKATASNIHLLRAINAGRTQQKTASNFQNKAIKPWKTNFHVVGDRKRSDTRPRKGDHLKFFGGGGVINGTSGGLPQGFAKKIVWIGANGDNEGLMNEHKDHVHAAMGAGYQAVIAAAKQSGVGHTVGSTVRPGAKDFHGAGKAVDFPGFNQDKLAEFFGHFPGVVELIHRTSAGDYGIFSTGGGGGPLAALNKFFKKGLAWVFKNMLEPVIGEAKKLFPKGNVAAEMAPAVLDKMVEGIKKKITEEYEKQLSNQNASGPYGGPISTAQGSPLFEALEQAKLMNASKNAVLAMVAAGIVESGWRNILKMLDHDSIGVLQQRTSQGWGSLAQLASPAFQAANFLSRYQDLGSIGQSAQNVQKSAFPGRYQAVVPQAMALLKQAGYPGFFGGGLVFDQGGMLPTGTSIINNNTGKPEPLVNSDLLRKETADAGGDTTVLVYVDGVLHAARVEVQKNNAELINALDRGRGI